MSKTCWYSNMVFQINSSIILTVFKKMPANNAERTQTPGKSMQPQQIWSISVTHLVMSRINKNVQIQSAY